MAKKKTQDGLDVLTEIKEPFSFSRFFEDHVVEKIKTAKRFLEEKGVLYFFLSPFTKRSRLILTLVLLSFGVLAGVIPRTQSLIHSAKERNAASEMAALIEDDTFVVVGSLGIKPLASSQYGRQHLLAFLLSPGKTGTLIPVKADRYLVRLAANRGVSHADAVSYSYEVFSVSDSNRLLLVYVDNREQDDATGIYDLAIQIENEEIPAERMHPLEIVLSDTQNTTDLFDETGVDLSILTGSVLGTMGTPIADAEESLLAAYDAYEITCNRILNLPVEMTPGPDVETLRSLVTDAKLYPTLTDASTTKDLESITELAEEPELQIQAGIGMNGIGYSDAYFEELASGPQTSPVTNVDGQTGSGPVILTEEEELLKKELASLNASLSSVTSALSSRNQAAKAKFTELSNYKLLLNRKTDVSDFVSGGTCLSALTAYEKDTES